MEANVLSEISRADFSRLPEAPPASRLGSPIAPLGLWLVMLDELPASLDLRIWLQKNDVPRQESRTSRMVFSVSQIVAHLSEFMTLLPGDLILTGTPQGVAYNKPEPDYLKEGDIIA
ncbi:fumarylacetoacetate hydrolase family protein [Paraburkholderia sp. IW21]|uniref:fumarylacetoacetate hydrolase family protein n=1 Tax=Paraburkholderia sp. IW21 TaxID=3242488 RepID=UPI0035202947